MKREVEVDLPKRIRELATTMESLQRQTIKNYQSLSPLVVEEQKAAYVKLRQERDRLVRKLKKERGSDD